MRTKQKLFVLLTAGALAFGTLGCSASATTIEGSDHELAEGGEDPGHPHGGPPGQTGEHPHGGPPGQTGEHPHGGPPGHADDEDDDDDGDGNRGHGNDEDGEDSDNPGRGNR